MRAKSKEIFDIIIKEVTINSNITEIELAKKCNCSERTIRRYIKDSNNIVIWNRKKKKWTINKE